MTLIKVSAHFGEIDKWGNGIFHLLDGSSIEKVNKHLSGDCTPIRGSRIVCKLPPGINFTYVGLRYIVTLRCKYYKFTSNMDKNKGELITGTKLIVSDLARVNDESTHT